MKAHHFTANLEWTGNTGAGTASYTAYDRSHIFKADGRANIECSSDAVFRGDKYKYNPEELFLASLSSCHMLWYLHLCAEAGFIVTSYTDRTTGVLQENEDGSGQFSEVVLHPSVTVTEESMVEKANALHHKANELCFIARSCNFPVKHRPTCVAAAASST